MPYNANMQEITNILAKLGLTETESAIYLTGLGYSAIGVSELEKQTRIKRTTIYHALNTLMQKGLVSKKGVEGRLIFSMTHPENIKRLLDNEINLIENRKKELDEIIPLLVAQKNQKSSEIKVMHYEGIQGIKLVVEEALYCKSKHWDIIAPEKNFFSEFDEEYADYYLKTRKENCVTARTLWEYNLPKRILTSEDIRERCPRYIPEIMHGKFKSVIIIFDDKVAIISSLKELSAILIQSKEVHDSMLAMFEGIWQNSKEYEELVKK
jgi:HTH-type transcriptional regulator, sugar sensing transcriptional regulator